MSTRKVEINLTAGPQNASVVIDGSDITEVVRRVVIDQDATNLATVYLELISVDVAVNIDGDAAVIAREWIHENDGSDVVECTGLGDSWLRFGATETGARLLSPRAAAERIATRERVELEAFRKAANQDEQWAINDKVAALMGGEEDDE